MTKTDTEKDATDYASEIFDEPAPGIWGTVCGLARAARAIGKDLVRMVWPRRRDG